MKKLFLLLFISVCCLAASAATQYEINVAGVEVTSDNASRITGGDITGGYAVYNASSNTLTCYNLNIYRTGQDNYGIHNRKCDNLKIVFSGSCDVRCADNALKLERSTTINAASGSNTTLYSSARIVMNLKSYNYYIQGSGNLNVVSSLDGYEAIKGEGLGSTNVYFDGAKVTASSSNRPALRSFTAYMRTGADLTIKANDEYYSVYDVYFSLAGRVAILEPYGAYVNSNSIYDSSGNQIASEDIYISDDYVALLKVNYFPDTKFIGALRDIFHKGYITANDVANCTSLSVVSKDISSLEGIHYFTELTSLYCSHNNLTSLNVSSLTKLQKLFCGYNNFTSLSNLPSGLQTLDCGTNQLTSLPTLPNTLEALYCGDNKLSGTFTLTGRTALTTLDVSNNTGLTTLNCYGNALTSLKYYGCSALKTIDCHSNKLASLAALPNSVTKFNCSANQLTAAPVLPSGLQELNCAVNRLTSLAVQGCNALTSLTIYGNQIKSNAMGTLVNGLRTIPAGSTGVFNVRIATDEGNEITAEQVRIARNKRWIPWEYTNGSWVEIPGGLVGDVNGDGKVNVSDVSALINMIMGLTAMDQSAADVNGDGKVNVSDVSALINIILDVH